MALPVKKAPGTWVQTDRATHEAWAALTRRSGLAAQIMHLLAARVGEFNAVVISQKTLAELAGVVWSGPRENLRYSKFNAVVIVSEKEQPNPETPDSRMPLRTLPGDGERQIASGHGLEPPSEPSLPGMEPDLPVLPERRSGAEDARPIGQIMKGLIAENGDESSSTD